MSIAVGYVRAGIGSFDMAGGTIDLSSTATPATATNLAIGTAGGNGTLHPTGGTVSLGKSTLRLVPVRAASASTRSPGETLQNTTSGVRAFTMSVTMAARAPWRSAGRPRSILPAPPGFGLAATESAAAAPVRGWSSRMAVRSPLLAMAFTSPVRWGTPALTRAQRRHAGDRRWQIDERRGRCLVQTPPPPPPPNGGATACYRKRSGHCGRHDAGDEFRFDHRHQWFECAFSRRGSPEEAIWTRPATDSFWSPARRRWESCRSPRARRASTVASVAESVRVGDETDATELELRSANNHVTGDAHWKWVRPS